MNESAASLARNGVSTDLRQWPSVGISIVNWNGWRETLDCLESVFRLDYPAMRVVVCDNGSTDESLDRIAEWAAGRQDAPFDVPRSLRHLFAGELSRPIQVDIREADAKQRRDYRSPADRGLVLVGLPRNTGYGAANNVAMRLLLAEQDCSLVWLLNNDTVVRPDALTALVRRIVSVPAAGMCGSKLVYLRKPDMVQALGGSRYGRWFGTARAIGRGSPVGKPVQRTCVEERMDYIAGASCLVTRRFVEDVGPMAEDYFLYYEELDWATRAGNRYRLGFAEDSVVYHREGAAAGSATDNPAAKSDVSDFFEIRNRLRFAARFHPWRLATVVLGVGAAMLNRLRRGQVRRALMIVAILLGAGDVWERRYRRRLNAHTC